MLLRPKHVRSSSGRAAPRKAKNAEKDKPKGPWHKRLIKDWVVPLALVFAVLGPIRASIADWNDVPSGSMRPTIIEGDRIYVNKLAYGLRIPLTTTWIARWDTPRRGEVVTLKSPADGVRLVKRVIGLPGDTVSMQGNRLTINGESAEYSVLESDVPFQLPDGHTVMVTLKQETLVDEAGVPVPETAHSVTIAPAIVSENSFKPFVVPEGQYFMMGDNRDMSRDSRKIGCVKLEHIYGRSSYIALSVDPENYYRPRFGRWFSEMK